MGDRGCIKAIRSGSESVMLYTHWRGSTLLNVANSVVALGDPLVGLLELVKQQPKDFELCLCKGKPDPDPPWEHQTKWVLIDCDKRLCTTPLGTFNF